MNSTVFYSHVKVDISNCDNLRVHYKRGVTKQSDHELSHFILESSPFPPVSPESQLDQLSAVKGTSLSPVSPIAAKGGLVTLRRKLNLDAASMSGTAGSNIN